MTQPEFESVARFIQNANPFDANVMEAAVEDLHGLMDRVSPSAAWDPRSCLDSGRLLLKYRTSLGEEDIKELPQRVANLVRAAAALLGAGPLDAPAAPALPTAPHRPQQVRLTMPIPTEAEGDEDTSEHLRENRLRMISELALGEIMIELGMIKTEQLLTALEAQRATGLRFGEALVDLGSATWPDIHKAMEVQDQYRGRAKAGQ